MLHLHRWVWLPTYEDGTECSETLAYKLQTPANHPESSIQFVSNLPDSAKTLDVVR
jgi:hypothetical protein